MKDCEVYTALENVINGIKKATPYFSKTQVYLNKYSLTDARSNFDEGCKYIDSVLEKAIKTYRKYGGDV